MCEHSLFRLQANQSFKTDYHSLLFASDQIGFLCSDITNLLRHICRNVIGIAFQTTSKCGLEPISKHFDLVFP